MRNRIITSLLLLATFGPIFVSSFAMAQDRTWFDYGPSAAAPVVRFIQDEDIPTDSSENDDESDDLLLPLLELESILSEPVVVTIPTVVAASRREEKANEAPSTVIVIDRKDIVLRGYSQLTDVLRDLPGMETIPYYFSEFGTQVPIRGISGNNKIVVLINGMRVNPPGGENFPFRNDFSVRHAERVEVVYGSGSTLYGQDAISAVINVVTRGPDQSHRAQTVSDDGPLYFNTVAAAASDGGSHIELGTDLGVNLERDIWGWYGGYLHGNENIKISTYFQYHDSELTAFDREYPSYWQGYRDVAITKTNANGGGVVPSRQDYGLNVFARVEGYDSSFQVWHRDSQRSSSEGFNPGLGFLPEAQWGDLSTVIEAKNTKELRENVTLESALHYNRYEIDTDSRFVFPADATNWFLDDFKYGRGWRIGLEETLRVEVTDRLSLLGGGLISYSDSIPKATFLGGFDRSMDPLAQGGSFTYTDGGPPITIPQVSQVKFWTYAAYLEGQVQVTDKLSLVGGVRVTKDDHFDEVPITPRATAIYSVTDRLTAKYIYTEAFVAPSPYFAFSTFDNGTLLATTNPDVAPETAQTHELAFTYYDDYLAFGLASYYGTQSDIITVADRGAPQNIVSDPVFLNGNPAEPRTLVQTANGGNSVRYGADIYGKLTLGQISSWLSYSFVDFEETNGTATTGLPGISKHNGRFGITWAATPNLFITPSLTIRSTPENVQRGQLARELQDPWDINLYALYQYCDGMDVFLNLRNITDNHNALGGFTGVAIPQETFNGVAGVRLMY